MQMYPNVFSCFCFFCFLHLDHLGIAMVYCWNVAAFLILYMIVAQLGPSLMLVWILLCWAMGKGVAFDGVRPLVELLTPFYEEHGSEFLGPYTANKSVEEIKTEKGKQRLRKRFSTCG